MWEREEMGAAQGIRVGVSVSVSPAVAFYVAICLCVLRRVSGSRACRSWSTMSRASARWLPSRSRPRPNFTNFTTRFRQGPNIFVLVEESRAVWRLRCVHGNNAYLAVMLRFSRI